ncbi:2Fe-2S iron-sulfur cluster binding domain-containing protein [Pedobacter frigidisoli]|uniref:2Fe-2S iron-sulfur cluster binding domain-containing protein n=1 Tax=Pedobacter frigidisoli TaxID=2530455 RepID=A0A4R0NCR7_9SPHI|nr:2Fe-2S iron-sulfur cluster-binding protein [Pedobacter frigidisoli]TCC98130.1 2Fe-2S iron-sulfur cluster binding domain-containing protein [Pedobacter frigidisoli]
MKEGNENLRLTEAEKDLFNQVMPEDLAEIVTGGIQRRHFLKLLTVTGGALLAFQLFDNHEVFAQSLITNSTVGIENGVKVAFMVNGQKKQIEVDSRMTLLDTLRERLGLTGSKKGCDQGQCGACTVIVEGRRVLSCLTLAATCEGKSVTTIEGLANGLELHAMQAAFIKHDSFQCGYCTSGQICSAVALMTEVKNGEASYVTPDIRLPGHSLRLSDDEIRERMSGNICRCGAYPNINNAIKEVYSGKDVPQTWQFSS